jgi:Papain family cysteine protease
LSVDEQPQAEAETMAAATAVHEFDWRRRLALAPPSHQGRCNTCTSFAIAATIEAHWQIAHPQNPISISAGYTHTCLGHGGNTDAATVCQFGIDIRAALGLLQTRGIARRVDGDYPFPSQLCASTDALKRLRRFAPVTDTQMARNEIASRGPIVADMYFWADFFTYSTTRAPAYVPDTSLEGPYLHAVCVVGFNSAGWIVKNSFGATWGDGSGYAVIAHGQCALLGAPPPPGGFRRQAYAIDVETATT